MIKQMKEANKKKEEKIKELQEFISAILRERFQIQTGYFQKDEPLKRSSWTRSNLPAGNIRTSISVRTARSETKFLRSTDLSKTIDGVKVLDNVSFILGREDKVAFVGGNELAKTTLFKILAGEMEPDSGSLQMGRYHLPVLLPEG